MGTIGILLLLCCTNPQEFDKQTIHINDGYIELNHYWVQAGESRMRNINGKDVYYGYCNYDQIIIRKYNKYNYAEIVHSSVIRDGRVKDQLTGEALEKHKKDMYNEWQRLHIQAAKDLDGSVQDVVVFHDSPFTGGRGINKVEFNHRTKRYEVVMKAYMGRYLDEPENNPEYEDRDENVYTFTAMGFRETNTLYSPENEDLQLRGIGTLDASFLGTRHIFREIQLRKKGIKERVPPIIPFWAGEIDG